ncbi:MAG TPA: 6,7-dimethyl-8-ribityllumazine synthase [Candidatus Deferrimicrobium sp.]|nr:6,7-dimethyl-8-ribityllumazine synthase [Candidatus Kapabacteria bacterium]HLP60417.1 6,7-dimethyl-8-ribityllumazine synthase [Candidatus Deferrimicrobium sp.]
MKEYNGELTAKGFKFAIIVSRFNDFITARLLDGAIDAIARNGGDKENIDVFRVPGSFEIPLVAKRIAKAQKHDAIICLGAVIRGETPHFDYVANEVTKGIAQLNLEFAIPIAYGIITADNTDQAIERAGNKMGNKGFQSALAAMELLNLFRDGGI